MIAKRLFRQQEADLFESCKFCNNKPNNNRKRVINKAS